MVKKPALKLVIMKRYAHLLAWAKRLPLTGQSSAVKPEEGANLKYAVDVFTPCTAVKSARPPIGNEQDNIELSARVYRHDVKVCANFPHHVEFMKN